MIQKIICCKGNNYEIGRRQGELLHPEISQNLMTFWGALEGRGYQKKEFLKRALRHEGLLSSGRLEEIEGIGDGAGIDYPEVLAYNLFHDVAFPEGCTVLMAVGKSSATGETIFLKNSDKVGSESYVVNSYKNKEINVIVLLNPKEGHKIIGVAAAVVLGSALFSTLSLIIACIVKTRERFMGIGQVLTMPIFFASNAIYPLSLMPGWLSAVSHINPLTYQVDILRAMMLTQGTSEYGLLLDFGVLLAVTAVLTSVAAKIYARMGY